MVSRLITLAAAFVTFMTNGAESRVVLSKTPGQLRENVGKVVTVKATMLANAISLMKSNGFQCVVTTQGLFDEQVKIGQFVRHTNVSYLHCSRVRKSFGLVQTRFIVALAFDNSTVITNIWTQVWEEGLLP